MNAKISSRRLLLHGALAAGCGLIVPPVLFGSAASGADSATPETPGKVPPASGQYRTRPKGELKCGDGANFITGSNACKPVEGNIGADGWCSLWTKKA